MFFCLVHPICFAPFVHIYLRRFATFSVLAGPLSVSVVAVMGVEPAVGRTPRQVAVSSAPASSLLLVRRLPLRVGPAVIPAARPGSAGAVRSAPFVRPTVGPQPALRPHQIACRFRLHQYGIQCLGDRIVGRGGRYSSPTKLKFRAHVLAR